MERYLFVGSNSDRENADALIDAETVEQAKALYHQWCEDVLGEPIDAAQVCATPKPLARFKSPPMGRRYCVSSLDLQSF